MTTRRQFILTTIPTTAVLMATSNLASAQAHLEESDPLAAALGYKHDSSKIDAKKYPAKVANANCGGCQLFQGKTSDAWGACGAVGGKQVNAKGWCSAWVKKA